MSTVADSDIFLVNRSSTSYQQTYQKIVDGEGNSSDLFVVNRGNNSYTITRDELLNGDKLLDSDLLLANRGGVSYKVTGADFKEGLVCITDLIIAYDPPNPLPEFGTWTAVTAAAAQTWTGVAYGNGLFVSTSSDGSGVNRVMTSTDGIAWSMQVGAEAMPWQAICFGDTGSPSSSKFITVANSGSNRCQYSSDGISWGNAPSISQSAEWCSVAFGRSNTDAPTYVAVGSDGTGNRVAYSSNGSNWTTASSATESWKAVICNSGEKFVVVGNNRTSGVPTAMTSPQGQYWDENYNGPSGTRNFTSVAYGNDKYVAVASDGSNRVLYSSNGVSWNTANGWDNNAWEAVTFGDDTFVAVASTGDNRIITSKDGVDWTTVVAPEQNSWKAITYGDSKFVAVATDGTHRVMYNDYTLSDVHTLTFESAKGFECIAEGSAIKQEVPLTPVTSPITNVDFIDRVAQLSVYGSGSLANPELCWDGDNSTGVTNTSANANNGITWTPNFGDGTERYECGTWITVNCPGNQRIDYDGRYSTGNTPVTTTVDGDNTFEVCYSSDTGYLQHMYVYSKADFNAKINSISVGPAPDNTTMIIGGADLTFQDDTQLNNFQPGDEVRGPDNSNRETTVTNNVSPESRETGGYPLTNFLTLWSEQTDQNGASVPGRGNLPALGSANIWTPATPYTGITSFKVRYIYGSGGATNLLGINGTPVTGSQFIMGGQGENDWNDYTSLVGGTLTSFGWAYQTGTVYVGITGIEINGVEVLDHQTCISVTPASNEMTLDGGAWDIGDVVTGPVLDGRGICASKDSGANKMEVTPNPAGGEPRFAIGTKVIPDE